MLTFEIFKQFLELSALILGLVNGLILLYIFLRDKPKIIVNSIENSMQGIFNLPNGKYQDFQTRRFGIMIDLEIINRGLRDVQISSWNIKIKTRNLRKIDLKPRSITNPVVDIGNGQKFLPVLGISSPGFSGDTVVKSGHSIAGFAYYIYECYGDENWDPLIDEDKIIVDVTVVDVYGKKSLCLFSIPKLDPNYVKTYFKDIENINSN